MLGHRRQDTPTYNGPQENGKVDTWADDDAIANICWRKVECPQPVFGKGAAKYGYVPQYWYEVRDETL